MSVEIISTPPGVAVSTEDDDTPLEAEQVSLEVALSEHGERVDKWLAQRWSGLSRVYFQQLLAGGQVQTGDRVVLKPATRVQAGERWRVCLQPTARAQCFSPEAMHLPVVYEDEHLMVVDKPAGLVVHPAAGHWSGTLLNGLLAHHAGAAALPRAGIVHRLDKDTSGLMVVGKTQTAVDALAGMIARREVHRIYLALAHGHWPSGLTREVDQPMARDPRQRLRMAVCPPPAIAKPARTDMVGLDSSPTHALVGCKLHTGRTHQIRVHMAWLGYPLVGDALYGGRVALGLQRQALHAHRLVLRHPVLHTELRLESPLPADMAGALALAGLKYNPEHLWQVPTV